jgi:hypothetical protein
LVLIETAAADDFATVELEKMTPHADDTASPALQSQSPRTPGHDTALKEKRLIPIIADRGLDNPA